MMMSVMMIDDGTGHPSRCSGDDDDDHDGGTS